MFPLGVSAHFPDGSDHGALPVLLRVVFGGHPLVVGYLRVRACAESKAGIGCGSAAAAQASYQRQSMPRAAPPPPHPTPRLRPASASRPVGSRWAGPYPKPYRARFRQKGGAVPEEQQRALPVAIHRGEHERRHAPLVHLG